MATRDPRRTTPRELGPALSRAVQGLQMTTTNAKSTLTKLRMD